jgi:hypothetical protein
MNKIQKPAWLIFAQERREYFGKCKISKGGRREEDSMYRDFRKACDEMGYEGTMQDWFYLMGWRGTR